METGLYVLYEIEDGKMTLSQPSARFLKKDLVPLAEYLKLQARFKVLQAADVQSLQQEVNAKWAAYREQML